LLSLVHPNDDVVTNQFEDLPNHVYKRHKQLQQPYKPIIENVIEKKPRSLLAKKQKAPVRLTLEEEIDQAIEAAVTHYKPVIEEELDEPKPRSAKRYAHETWALPIDREEQIPHLSDEDYQHYVEVRQKHRQPYRSSVYKKVFQPKSTPVSKESRENMKNVLLNQFELTTVLNNQLTELKKKSNSPKKKL
jgi:hypothetical protein